MRGFFDAWFSNENTLLWLSLPTEILTAEAVLPWSFRSAEQFKGCNSFLGVPSFEGPGKLGLVNLEVKPIYSVSNRVLRVWQPSTNMPPPSPKHRADQDDEETKRQKLETVEAMVDMNMEVLADWPSSRRACTPWQIVRSTAKAPLL